MRLHLGTLGWLFMLSALSPWSEAFGAGAEAISRPEGSLPNNAALSTPATMPTSVPPTNQTDLAAARFATTCAGCHSLAGLKLTGPELSAATAWPMDQLKTAIKRMEKNVGPLTEEQVAALADLLRSPNVRDRIKAEQERIQTQFMAKMAPPDAAAGHGLFLGKVLLQNGGLACAACHTAAGVGGNLGPDLTGVFTKLGGQTPLISAIEKANFKIMAPHYQRHPVTTQEAMHLAKYFSTLNPKNVVVAGVPFMPVGAGGAIASLVGLTFYFRAQRKNRGRDTRLQRRRN